MGTFSESFNINMNSYYTNILCIQSFKFILNSCNEIHYTWCHQQISKTNQFLWCGNNYMCTFLFRLNRGVSLASEEEENDLWYFERVDEALLSETDRTIPGLYWVLKGILKTSLQKYWHHTLPLAVAWLALFSVSGEELKSWLLHLMVTNYFYYLN